MKVARLILATRIFFTLLAPNYRESICQSHCGKASSPTGKAGVELLRPAPNDLLHMWPVSKRVNVSRRGDEDARLIEPIEGEVNAARAD